jgi:hypothetical protein
MRRDIGQSFVSTLVTAREVLGGGSNHVFGPDFQWRPRPSDSVTGQFLWSESRTPDRPDLNDSWDGRRLSDGAGLLSWSHGTRHEDCFLQFQSLGSKFRADDGFIPQVGFREVVLDAGYTVRPKGFLSRIRFFTTDYANMEPDGDVLNQRVSIGSGMDGKLNSFIRWELNQDAIRVGSELLRRFRPRLQIQANPTRVFNSFTLDSFFGQEIDFANGREGTGATLTGTFTVRPDDHLELRGTVSRRWLDVDDANGVSGRLFTARVERLRATWAFNSRSFVRLIGQYTQTTSDTTRYTFETEPKQATFSGSALFAYKLNWQTVLYAGFGDQHEYDAATDRLEVSSRQFFTKVSYAWQP